MATGTINRAGNSWKLVWTNPTPGNDFGAQKVAVDLSGYTQVGIVLITNKTYQYMLPLSEFWIGIGTSRIFCPYPGTIRQRNVVSIDSTGVDFGDTLSFGTYGSPTSTTITNENLIPYQIYAR